MSELNKSKTAGYLELYRRLCSAYKKVSRAAYDFHMKKLLNEKMLQNRDNGRGKSVFYFLSAEAKQKLRLQIMQHKSKKEQIDFSIETEEEKRQILYILLFFFQMFSHKGIFSSSEEKFDEVLNEFGLTRKDLIVEKVHLVNAPPDTGYNKERVTRFKRVLGFIFNKHEKPILEGDKQSWNLIGYYCALPGTSMSDFLREFKYHALEHIGFTREELQIAIDNLVKEGLLKPGMRYDNEVRYVTVADELLDLVSNFMGLFNLVLSKMCLVWTYIRRPTVQDEKWLQIIYGIKDAEECFKEIRYDRHSLTKRKKRKKIAKVREQIKLKEHEIDQEIDYLVQTYKNIVDQYRFPCERMLEMLYPSYLQKSLITK